MNVSAKIQNIRIPRSDKKTIWMCFRMYTQNSFNLVNLSNRTGYIWGFFFFKISYGRFAQQKISLFRQTSMHRRQVETCQRNAIHGKPILTTHIGVISLHIWLSFLSIPFFLHFCPFHSFSFLSIPFHSFPFLSLLFPFFPFYTLCSLKRRHNFLPCAKVTDRLVFCHIVRLQLYWCRLEDGTFYDVQYSYKHLKILLIKH